ncbi:MAG: MBL fold metallo-hydrolase [Pseudomonadota bacterium]
MSLWMKGLIGLAVLVVVAFIGFRVFQNAILWSLFDRGVQNNLLAEPGDSLPDGLHVFLCGTGSPMPDNLRAGPCVGVIAGEKAFVFDAGSGSIRKLGRMQFPFEQLERAYLTHLHSDHIDGLGELYLQAWVAGGQVRTEPLPIAGPRGTARVVNAFNEAYTIDRGYRVAHHGADLLIPSGFGAQPEEIVLPIGPSASAVVLEDSDVTVTAIRASHAPIEPAFGYRIDYKDRSVSISGDTIFHPGFVAASRGVDIMLHEAEDPEMVNRIADGLRSSGREATAKILTDTLDYHATPEDAARAAAEADAGELVFYHLVPPLPSPALNRIWLGEAGDVFPRKITIGEDGMLLSLPAGSDRVERTMVF